MPVETASENNSEAIRWRRIRRTVLQRAVAIALGISIWLVIAFLPPHIIGAVEWRWFGLHIVSYTFASFVLSFLWPDAGWRLGVYVFAIWPVMLLLMFAITDPPTVIYWKGELVRLFVLFMILPAACAGGWIGATLRRRFSGDASS